MVAELGSVVSVEHDSKRINKAVRDLKARNATGDEVRRRAKRYRDKWPNVELTPESLVKHWQRFAEENVKQEPMPNVFASERGERDAQFVRDMRESRWTKDVVAGMTDAEILANKDALQRGKYDELVPAAETST